MARKITWTDLVWPVVGMSAVAFSAWLLYHDLRGISVDDVIDGLTEIPTTGYLLSGLCALLAYGALAGYDRIALMHLRRRVPWLFITLASFTTYALSHNIGASVLSGAVVRYRAYGSQGLSGREIGILVALCSFTFALGTILLVGAVLILKPDITDRFVDVLPIEASRATGIFFLMLVGLYVFGSWIGLKPLRIGGFELHYPRLAVVARQLAIGPIELIGAAGIIYFALPEAGNPGFVVILGIFLASFSLALISHAPGGLGVLEFVFLAGLPEMDQVAVLAALLVFRLFYLIIPLIAALVVVLMFERSQWARRLTGSPPGDPPVTKDCAD